MRSLVFVVFAASLSGCVINQAVNPVPSLSSKAICIVENPAVRPGFLQEYRSVLEEKGYSVKIMPRSATITECPTTSTYVARWHWDMALYMEYAEIRVYNEGTLAGKAVYDARRGGGRPDKFINGDSKVRELVSALYQ